MRSRNSKNLEFLHRLRKLNDNYVERACKNAVNGKSYISRPTYREYPKVCVNLQTDVR